MVMEILSIGSWVLLMCYSLVCIADGHSCNDERNLTATLGENATFVCCTDPPDPVGWRYRQQSDSIPDDIVEGSRIYDNYIGKVSVANRAAGVHSLTVHNVTFNDSGLYICGEKSFAGAMHTYALTVYNASKIEPTTGSDAWIAGVVVPVLAVVAVLIGVFVHLYIRRRKSRNKSKRRTTPSGTTVAENIEMGEGQGLMARTAQDDTGGATQASRDAAEAPSGATTHETLVRAEPPSDDFSTSLPEPVSIPVDSGSAVSSNANTNTSHDNTASARAATPATSAPSSESSDLSRENGQSTSRPAATRGVSDTDRSAPVASAELPHEGEQATSRTDTTSICERIRKHISKLITYVDCSSPLFREKLSTPTTETNLSDNPNVGSRILEMLENVTKSESGYGDFLRDLERTGQTHVVNFIKSDGSKSDGNSSGDHGGDWPLERKQQNLLDINRTKLAKLIVLDDQLLQRLVDEKKCLMDWQKELIRNIDDHEKKWQEFIYILKRRSRNHLDAFVLQIEQKEVRGLITPGHVAVEADVQLLVTPTNLLVEDVGKSIVEFFTSVSRNNSKNSKASALEDLAKFYDCGKLPVIARQHKVIGIFFFCDSVDVLSLLLSLYSSGQLQSILESVFKKLLMISETKVLKNVVFDQEYSSYRSFFRRASDFEEALECELMEKNCVMSFNKWLKNRENDWKEVIRKQFATLPRQIKVDGNKELYNHLTVICEKWWTKRLDEYVKSKGPAYGQVTELLTSLRTRPFDDFIGFCEALYQSGQIHIVVDLLTPEVPKLNISEPTKAPDTVTTVSSEPVITFNWKNLIRSNYMELLATIDPDSELLQHLLTKNVITDYNIEHFQAPLKKNRRLRVDALLQYMMRRPDRDFDILCRALEKTKQEFIVKLYLTPGGFQRKKDDQKTSSAGQGRDDVDDMEEVSEWRDLLRRNRVALLDTLVADAIVLENLHDFGVLNDYMYEHLREIDKSENVSRNEQLLDYISRRPPVDFSRFRVVLNNNRQGHIVTDYLTRVHDGTT